ncbi:ACP S-malonyltransferase [Auritidibacter ignavus]|uniref:ACP S-malonyltransferase n=1 Tax=Auritidibacter ignavus TaxID=678932 RepID=UPI0024B9A859|nr:ACP S-malonyltransferase [Auritidibacter ignavus]WHS35071.1 ACP S-malonyltransferase [Auritidibacter ignavus]
MLAIVCPGQGSQTPGFLTDWLELGDTRERLGTYSEATGIDLLAHGTVSDEQTIKDTAVAQPLIVAAGLITARALNLSCLDPSGWITAGHSVGEVTASALAGVLTESDALNFIKVRAAGMATAAATTPTGMAAVIGGDPQEVSAHIRAHDLTPANVNGGGQIVAAGAEANLQALADDPLDKTRVIPLKVAGAFHTDYMEPAVAGLHDFADTLSPADPTVRLLSNRDGQEVTDGKDVLDRLVSQLIRPVRWDLCQESLRNAGVTGLIELLPAGTLTGLAKRGLKGVKTLAIKTPDDLEPAQEFIAEHLGAAVEG